MRLMLHLFLLLLLLPWTDAVPCSTTGEWTSWNEWTPCRRINMEADKTTQTMNFKNRIRQCDARPVGCDEQSQQYSCPGQYSEITLCVDPTTPQPATVPTTSTRTTTTTTTTSTTTTTTRTTTTRPPTTITKGTTTTRPPTTITKGTTTTRPPTTITKGTTTTRPTTTTTRRRTTTTTAEPTTTYPADETTEMATTEAATTGAASSTAMDPGTEMMSTTEGTTEAASIAEASTAEATAETDGQPATMGTTLETGSSTEASAASTTEALGESTTGTGGDVSTTASSGESTTESGSGETSTAAETTGAPTGSGEGTDPMLTDTAASDGTTESGLASTTDSGNDGSTTDMASTEFGEGTSMAPVLTCDDCGELNIFLFDSEPYEDGASVLNRYTSDSCKYVQFFCRPFETGDLRPVRTVYDGDAALTGLPLNANIACENGNWIEQKQRKRVKSLSCVYDLPETTTAVPEITSTTPRTTTRFPGIDPNNPCMNCSYLVVSPLNTKEGATYLDHRLAKCLSVKVFCQPLTPDNSVELLMNGQHWPGLEGATVNRTFDCNAHSEWIDHITGEVIDNVACSMVPIGEITDSPGGDTTTGDVTGAEGTTLSGTTGGDTAATGDVTSGDTTPAGSTGADTESTGDVTEGDTTSAGTTDGGSSATGEVTDGGTTLSGSTGGDTAATGEATGGDTTPSGTTGFITAEDTTPSGTTLGDTEATREVTGGGTTPSGSTVENTETTEDITGDTTPSGSTGGDTAATSGAESSTPEGTTDANTSATEDVTGSEGTTLSGSTGADTESTGDVTSGDTTPSGTTESGTSSTEVVTGSESSTPSGSTAADTESTGDVTSGGTTETGTTEGSTSATGDVTGSDGTTLSGTTGADTESTENVSGGETTPSGTTEGSTSTTGDLTGSESTTSSGSTEADTESTGDVSSGGTTGTTEFNTSATSAVTGREEGTSLASSDATEPPSRRPITTTTTRKPISQIKSTTTPQPAMASTTTTIRPLTTTTTPSKVSTTTTTRTLTTTTSANGAITTTTVKTTDNGQCAACPNMIAQAVTGSDVYNGMIVLDHYNNDSVCRIVDIACRPKTESEETRLCFGTIDAVNGPGSHLLTLTCSRDGTWRYMNQTVTSVSCSVQRSVGPTVAPSTTTIPPSPPITVPTTTTKIPPGTVRCKTCARLPVLGVLLPGFTSGFTTLINGNNGNCNTIHLTCEGNGPSDNLTLFIGGMELARGMGKLTLNMTCNVVATWMTEQAIIVPQISCGFIPGASVTTTTGLTSTTSTTTNPAVGSTTSVPRPLTTVTTTTTTPTRPLTATTTSSSTSTTSLPIATTTTTIRPAATTTTTVAIPTTTTDNSRCAACPNMIAKPVNESNVYNGMIILDHYTRDSVCRVVDIACRPQSESEVSQLSLNSIAADYGPGSHSMTLNCSRDGTWRYQNLNITTVSCAVLKSVGPTVAPTTSTAPPVTVPVLTTTTTVRPGVDPCSICARLQVLGGSTAGFSNGFTTLINGNDGKCDTIQLTCEGNKPTDNLTLSTTGTVLAQGVGKLFLNLTCSASTTWATAGGIVVPQISCGIAQALSTSTSTSTTSTTTTPTPTRPLTTTTTASTTSTTSVPPTTTTTSSSTSTTSVPTTTTTTVSAAITTTTRVAFPTTTTTADNGRCAACPNMIAKPVNSSDVYNGMIVLDHYTKGSVCRMVDISCRPASDSETTRLLLGSIDAVDGQGSHSLTLTCARDGTWRFNNQNVTSVSCAVQKTIGPTAPPTPSTAPPVTLPTTTTPVPPGVDPCTTCARLPVLGLSSAGFANGFTTLLNGNNGKCNIVQLTCEGNGPSDNLTLVMTGTELAHGTGKLSLNLTCNAFTMWMTDQSIIVPHISCAIVQAPVTTTTSTTAATTTSVMTTTTTRPTTAASTTTTSATASRCNLCDNLLAAEPPMGPNQSSGMLVLDHFYEAITNCRVVVVRCKGANLFENMTIFLNGNIELPTVPYQVSNSLICSPSGTWMRLGQTIKTASCRMTSLPPDVTTPPPPVTLAPATTTTAPGTVACTICNRMLVRPVPVGYVTGFLTMDTYAAADTQCIGVFLSCSSPTPGMDVAIVSSAGEQLVRATNRVNMTMNCGTNGRWLAQTGQTVDTVSCGVVVGTTSSVTSTSSTTTTTTTSPLVTSTLGADCSLSTWQVWREWSTCTDTCGSCGTWQRFRACDKANPSCLCSGTAYEKVPCNLDVCKYPRNASCCDGFKPTSSDGRFQCMPTT